MAKINDSPSAKPERYAVMDLEIPKCCKAGVYLISISAPESRRNLKVERRVRIEFSPPLLVLPYRGKPVFGST
ncbi:MAG: hypothetical protein ACI89F_001028 [Porticoccaceae bacterium]